MDRTRSMLHSSIIGESSDDLSGSCVVFISTDTEENTIEVNARKVKFPQKPHFEFTTGFGSKLSNVGKYCFRPL